MSVPNLSWPRGVAPKEALLNVRSRRLGDHAEVAAALHRSGAQGWVCFTDRVIALDDIREPPTGAVLSAELALAEGGSLQVRRAADDWLLTEISEATEGEPVLFFDQGWESSRDGGPWRMEYRCYWRLRPMPPGADDPVPTWTPWVASFRGWRRVDGGEA